MMLAAPVLVLEEALDCVLVRVRWYTVRGFGDREIPEATRLAFNRLCDILGKPDERPWTRILTVAGTTRRARR